ncbi:hypothetical protein HPB48_008917 [Haemaphysalis longicornis]|uniref:Uncharacterized protein n=1 Tax=Haemaphysalis longicornis TaxID=44386 RepID=A0A9J6GAM9_HAELO|nr:hypothetical protein HPB48_008917 [Haemaphysalis longicornis]
MNDAKHAKDFGIELMSALHQKSKYAKAVPPRTHQKITDMIPSVPYVVEIIQQKTGNVVSDVMSIIF